MTNKEYLMNNDRILAEKLIVYQLEEDIDGCIYDYCILPDGGRYYSSYEDEGIINQVIEWLNSERIE